MRRQYLEFLGREPGKQALTSGVRAIANDQTVREDCSRAKLILHSSRTIEQWELMKLLIVEDNDRMRSLIRRTVADLAETIHECSDGAEALAAYNTNRPDCVLMDIKMGKMDGITATRNIRAAYPDARVIIVTDYDDDKLRHTAERAGACHYLVKENLLAIREVLSELFPAG